MLNEGQRMVRETARQFARRELAPGAAARDREHRFPREAIAAPGELGLMGMMVPEEFGGAGVDAVAYALAVAEIAAAAGAASTIMAVHNGLVCMPLAKAGTAEQKDRFLAPLAAGRHLGCFCLTEPEAGSDAAAIRTRARRDGDRYILDGSKQLITSGGSANTALVFAGPIRRRARRGCQPSSCRPPRPATASPG